MRKLSAALAILALAFGALIAWGEARPLAAILDTRPAALLCGVLALLFALPLRRRPRIVLGAAATILLGIAAWRYVQYAAIPVTFRSDVTLSGTLVRPRGVARPPVVVYIHGSGPETRREGRHFAQLFARHGIATLIYDKRGAGKSEGSTWSVGYEGYARDALAALRFIAARPDLDPQRIVVLAHSEAEWVLPLALAGAPPVRSIIVTSPSVMTPAQQVLYETGANLRRAGFDDQIIGRARSLQERVLDYQRTGRPSPGLEEELRRVSTEPWFDAAELPDRLWPIEEYRWWRGVMDFDGTPNWRRVRVPVLVLSGGRDPNSDIPRNQQRLRALLREAGNPHVTAHVFPEAEHGMIVWCLGERIPPPCWPPTMPEILVDWVLRTTTPGR